MIETPAAPKTVPMVFKRHEQKYVMDQDTYQRLLVALENEITIDQFGRQTISSLYYDTDSYMFARRQLDDSKYREKLRLRAYGSDVTADQTAFIELKKKVLGITYKRRIAVPYHEAKAYLAGEGGLTVSADMNKREIDFFVQDHSLTRNTAVIYERSAYATETGLRLTFDENIRWRTEDTDLLTGTTGTPLLAPGMVVMEIKIPQTLPFAWSHLFAGLKIYPQPFSKYGLIYKYGILGGQQCLSAI
ncbi:VTC domain-containing protein [Furfurilactobacillus sp. WILCCON 0119]